MFRVSAFARLAGLSAKVLRDYDEAGLFLPAWVDRDTGYRLYSPAQLPELRRIVALRELGLGLADIRALVVGGGDLRAALDQRRRELEQVRRDADRRLAALGISIAAARRGGSDEPDVVVRDVPAELVATLEVAAESGDVGAAFYELERQVQRAGVRAPRPPGSLFHEPPSGTAEPRTEVFVPIRRGAPALATRRLPAIHAATLLHRGAYDTFDDTRAALEAWVVRHRLAGVGPLRVVYLQFGAEPGLRLPRDFVVERAADLLTEIQLPLG
ncbi:MAG TPA: MerR family transcriptional regulator [Candidatus Limnocylindrales bacterium]